MKVLIAYFRKDLLSSFLFNLMGESDREIRAIEHYVRLYRARLGITPTPGFKIGEPSGLMEGEGRTLFVSLLELLKEMEDGKNLGVQKLDKKY